MKNLRRAAIAAVAAFATLVGSSSLFANSTGWVVTTHFDNQTETVTGLTKLWEEEALRGGNGTEHQFVGNPNLIPPGACRNIAFVWNLFVFTNRPTTWFNNLLRDSAQHNCNIAFTRTDGQNPDGSFNLVTVSPSK
jgi:hypothetical protein